VVGRLLPIPVGLWLGIISVLVVVFGSTGWRILFVCILAAAGSSIFTTSRLRYLTLFALPFLVIGIVLGLAKATSISNSTINQLIQEQRPGLATFELRADPVRFQGKYQTRQSAEVTLKEFQTFHAAYEMRTPGRLVFEGESNSKLVIGETVTAQVVLRAGEPMRGRAFTAYPKGSLASISKAPWWQVAAANLRAGLAGATKDLPADSAALIPGLTLGDTSQESSELTEAMRASGLAHLTAVSGANVAIVVGAVVLLLRALGFRRAWAIGAAALAVVGFAVLVRFEPSVLRASVMALVGLLAIFLGRPKIPGVALISAVTLLLLVDPWLALSWGFALSVSATAGIVWFAPALVTRSAARWPRAPKYLVLAMALTISAQVATAPLVAALGNNSLLVGVPANLLAMPVVPFITLSGLVITFVEPVAPSVAVLLATLTSPLAEWVGLVARLGSRSWFADIPWPDGTWGAAATLGVIGLVGLLIFLLRERRSKLALLVASAIFTFVGGLFLANSQVSSTIFSSWPPRDWQVVACDVGQGDALVFRLTKDSAIVSDVGADAELITNCLHQLGVLKVPMVLLTHFHSDHAGAIGALVPFDPQLIGVTSLQSPPQVAALVTATARGARAPVHVLSAGNQLQIFGTKITVIWPPRKIEPVLELSQAPENDASLVFLVEQQTAPDSAVIRTLVTGDIELAAQAHLARHWPGLLVDIYKVPHHGSRVQDERIAGLVGARHAIISVGAENDFGHPQAVTVSSLEQAGMRVHRSDLSGDIAFSSRDGELVVTTRR